MPYLPQQPGYHKRLRQLSATLNWLIGALARDTSVWTDDVWVVDSTPVECARSGDSVKRSDLPGGPNTVTEQANPGDMMAALIRGERNPQVLAQMARTRMRTKIPQLEEAFVGYFTEHHRFLLALP